MVAGLGVDDLLSVREASRLTGVPTRTLYDWIAKEKINSFRISDVLFIHRHDAIRIAIRLRDE